MRDEFDINPVHVQAVLLCTVRICSQKNDLDLCFELISPNKRVYTLQSETEEQRRTWMDVFANCSESLLNNSGSILTAQEQGMSEGELKRYTDAKMGDIQELRLMNATCVDCGAKGQQNETMIRWRVGR